MSVTRSQIPRLISSKLDGRPARWVPAGRLVGDFNGRDRTIEVFNAEVPDRMSLLEKLEGDLGEIEEVLGAPLVVLYFTRAQTEVYAPEMVSFPSAVLNDFVRGKTTTLTDEAVARFSPSHSVFDPAFEEVA